MTSFLYIQAAKNMKNRITLTLFSHRTIYCQNDGLRVWKKYLILFTVHGPHRTALVHETSGTLKVTTSQPFPTVLGRHNMPIWITEMSCFAEVVNLRRPIIPVRYLIQITAAFGIQIGLLIDIAAKISTFAVS